MISTMHWNALSICQSYMKLIRTWWAMITFVISRKTTRSYWISKWNTQTIIFIKVWIMMTNTSSVMLGIMMTQTLNGELLYLSKYLRIKSSGYISSCSTLVKSVWDNLSNNATIIINFVTPLTSINVNTAKDINCQAKVMDSYLSVKWKCILGNKSLSIW